MKSILISNLHKSIEEINFLDLVIKLTGGIIVLKGWTGKTFNFYAIYAPILYSAQPPSIMVSATPCSPAKIVNPYNSPAPSTFTIILKYTQINACWRGQGVFNFPAHYNFWWKFY